MDMIQMVLTLIRATRKTTLNYMLSLSVCLVPNVYAKDHNNCAQYVPVYLITLINLIHIADAKNFSNKMGLVCHNHWFFA